MDKFKYVDEYNSYHVIFKNTKHNLSFNAFPFCKNALANSTLELIWKKSLTDRYFSDAKKSFTYIDLGHVHSGQGELPRGPRNGPSRQRRREKREAARAEKKAAEDFETLPAVEAEKESESEENVEIPDAEEAQNLKKIKPLKKLQNLLKK